MTPCLARQNNQLCLCCQKNYLIKIPSKKEQGLATKIQFKDVHIFDTVQAIYNVL